MANGLLGLNDSTRCSNEFPFIFHHPSQDCKSGNNLKVWGKLKIGKH